MFERAGDHPPEDRRPGFGAQAYWATGEHAAGYMVVKGQYIYSVLIGGEIGDAEAYKTSLYNLAVDMAERI